MHPKRKTIGIRVPDNNIAQAFLEQVDEPIMSTSLVMPGQELPLIEPEAIRDLLGKQVDLIIDGGYCGVEQTSVVEFIDGMPNVLRYGKGDVTAFEQYKGE
jgi:tRNA threonylcarbamoyl adenosine modification protein (Sua5/YciO/YrdC/YwlC family)